MDNLRSVSESHSLVGIKVERESKPVGVFFSDLNLLLVGRRKLSPLGHDSFLFGHLPPFPQSGDHFFAALLELAVWRAVAGLSIYLRFKSARVLLVEALGLENLRG